MAVIIFLLKLFKILVMSTIAGDVFEKINKKMKYPRCKGKGYRVKKWRISWWRPVIYIIGWMGFTKIVKRPGEVHAPINCKKCGGTGKKNQ